MGYKPELNFITEFKLSRNGMLLELKKEFNIIRLALTQMKELGADYKEMLDCIAVMPLRKILFENQHTSLIFELCPDFKCLLPQDVPLWEMINSILNLHHIVLVRWKIG